MTADQQPQTSRLLIAGRFRGPPNSGNGGYAAGAIAELLDPLASVEVTLRSPVPLDEPLAVTRVDSGLLVHRGDTLVAEARRAPLALAVPPPPDRQAVAAAEHTSPAFWRLPNPIIPDGFGIHPICFCCSADRPDGLRVFTAPVPGTDQVAALWRTDPAWADADGGVPLAFLWTALDCPAQFAYIAGGVMTGLLGRMTARIERPCKAGEEVLVTGWRIAVDGKKHYGGTALFNQAGELIGRALTVWIGRREGFLPG